MDNGTGVQRVAFSPELPETASREACGCVTPERALRIYRYALVFSLLFTVLHVLSLPLVVSYDGYLYFRLADVIGTSRFPAEWDFLRTPLFPLWLKVFFKLLGRQALAVIALNSLLGLLGCWLTAAALKRMGHPVAAACATLAITLYPTLVGYEHCLLSEAGTFFFVAMLFNLLLWDAGEKRLLKTAALTLTLAAGYYYRPTVLYMAPVAAAIYWLSLSKAARASEAPRTWRPWLHAAVVAFLPFLAAAPWMSRPEVKAREASGVYCYAIAKQALLAPDDPMLGPMKAHYIEGINSSLRNGRLNLSGVVGGREYAVCTYLTEHYGDGAAVFRQVVWKNPYRYLAGVARTVLLFAGFPGLESDNSSYRDMVIANETGATFLPGPPDLQPTVEAQLARKTGASMVARVLKALRPFYDLLTLFGFSLTVAALLVGLWQMDDRLLALTALPAAFLVMHALLAMSVDRLVLPVYPLLLANLCVLPQLTFLKRPRAAPAVPTAPAPAASDRYAFVVFLAILAVLVVAHLLYLFWSRSMPTSDEGHYMGGAARIVNGFRGAGLAGAWHGYLDALTFKLQFICVPAALLMLVTGEFVGACMLSMVVLFIAIGLAGYSFFRNLFSPAYAAVAAALLLTMPLINGLTHRFFVENYLVLFSILLLDILLRHGGRTFRWCALERHTWVCLLLVAAVTFVATTALSAKTTRWTATWLPCIAALAALALRGVHPPRRSLYACAATVLLSLILCLHNSFAILPVPDLAIGPLRAFASSFPLNTPGWVNDNHPVERRDFRAPLSLAEETIATDAAEHFRRNVVVRTTVHGLYLNHDYLYALAVARGHPVYYEWWPDGNLNAPGAPDYILDAKGHRAAYSGSHYFEWYPNLERDLASSKTAYDLFAHIPGPSDTMLVIYRKRMPKPD
ncbi:MAG: hypothetical protein NTW87_13730 [Planctomycetota bacterium]|nr:hypothetical protein [Planctomycetota bacterium]